MSVLHTNAIRLQVSAGKLLVSAIKYKLQMSAIKLQVSAIYYINVQSPNLDLKLGIGSKATKI